MHHLTVPSQSTGSSVLDASEQPETNTGVH